MLKFSTDVATNKGRTHRFRGVRLYFHDPRLLPPKERLASFANCCKIAVFDSYPFSAPELLLLSLAFHFVRIPGRDEVPEG